MNMTQTVVKPAVARPPVEGRIGVEAVNRAISLLRALEASAKPMTLADLARATGLYKSTILRLLVSLENSRLVVRRPDQRYALGTFAWRLGCAFNTSFDLKATVLPVLQSLIEQGTESPSFHVRHDEETRRCLCRLDSNHSTLDRVREGDLLPLLFVSYGERDPSCAAVATAVFGPGGDLMGSLSLSGPLERFTPATVRKMTKPLLAAAERITRSLGGEWPADRPAIFNLSGKKEVAEL